MKPDASIAILDYDSATRPHPDARPDHPPRARQPISTSTYLLRIALFAIAYFLAGELGLMMAYADQNVSPVWPPTGIALAVLALGGMRYWPSVAIGAAAVTLGTGAPLGAVLGIALGNTLEGVAGAMLIRRMMPGCRFNRLADVLHFLLGPVLISCSIAATIGVLSLALTGAAPWAAFARIWGVWWIGDALGALVVTPFILTLSRPTLADLFSTRSGEAAVTGILLIVSALAIFNPWMTALHDDYAILMLVFPSVMWSALRFGPTGAAAAAMLLSTLAILGTSLGFGPFAGNEQTLAKQMVFLQFFVGVVAVSGLAVAAYTAEREHSERALREANAAKDRFLAVLSHELRTPLSPVMTIASSLENDPTVPPSLREDMELIRRNVELEVRLIDDLLDLTRVTRGKLELRLQSADVHDVIRQALSLCQGDVAGRDLSLRAHLNAASACVRADSARLQQVFWNLVKNAIKFTPTGEITVTSRNLTLDGREWLRVEVTDTGVGIEPDVLDRIFQPFEQGRVRAWQSTAGLGLGLAIGRQIVEAHGGRVAAHSDGVGRGATFTVDLPTIPAPVGRSACATPDADGQRRRRVLLVEDHDDTRRAMVRLLRRFGYDVEAAAGVASAIRVYEHALGEDRAFDLLISDLGLPDGSGNDLVRQLLRHGPLRAIALSGYGMEEDIQRSRNSGFCAHLTKPVNVARLQSEIDCVLGDEERASSLDPTPSDARAGSVPSPYRG